MYKRAEKVVEMVGGAAEDSSWSSSQYPNLNTPPSASLVLQRTLRDGLTINLPWALLVKQDLIILRQGSCSISPRTFNFPMLFPP